MSPPAALIPRYADGVSISGGARPASEGGERTGSVVGSAEEPRLPLQADWIGSWAAVAMALQCARGGGLAGDLCRDSAHVQEVGALAEAEGHHPDISFGWGYVTVSLLRTRIQLPSA